MDVDVRNMLDGDGVRLCRLCLDGVGDMVYVFDPKGYNGYRVWEIIKELLQLEVSKEDGLPGTICRECLKKVTEFKHFKTVCIKSKISILTMIASRGIVSNCSLQIPSATSHGQKSKEDSTSQRPTHNRAGKRTDLVEVVEDNSEDQDAMVEPTSRSSGSQKEVNKGRQKRDSGNPQAPSTSSHAHRNRDGGSSKRPVQSRVGERKESVEVIEDDSATGNPAKDGQAGRASRSRAESNKNQRKGRDSGSAQVSSTSSHGHRNRESNSSKRPAPDRVVEDDEEVEIIKDDTKEKTAKDGSASRSSSSRKESNKSRRKRENPSGRHSKIARLNNTSSIEEVIDCGLSDPERDKVDDTTKHKHRSSSGVEKTAQPAQMPTNESARKGKGTSKQSKNFTSKDAVGPSSSIAIDLEDETNGQESAGEPESSKGSRKSSKGPKSKRSSKSVQKGKNKKHGKEEGEASKCIDLDEVNFIEVPVRGDVVSNGPEAGCDAMVDPLATIKVEPRADCDPQGLQAPEQQSKWAPGAIYDSMYSNLGPVKEECLEIQGPVSSCPTRFQANSGASSAHAAVKTEPRDNVEMEFEEQKYSATLFEAGTASKVDLTANSASNEHVAGNVDGAVANRDPLCSSGEEDEVNFIEIVPQEAEEERWSDGSKLVDADEDPLADVEEEASQDAVLTGTDAKGHSTDGDYLASDEPRYGKEHIAPAPAALKRRASEDGTPFPPGGGATKKTRWISAQPEPGDLTMSPSVDIDADGAPKLSAVKTQPVGFRDDAGEDTTGSDQVKTTPVPIPDRPSVIQQPQSSAAAASGANGAVVGTSDKPVAGASGGTKFQDGGTMVGMCKRVPYVVLERLVMKAGTTVAVGERSREEPRNQELDNIRRDVDDEAPDQKEDTDSGDCGVEKGKENSPLNRPANSRAGEGGGLAEAVKEGTTNGVLWEKPAIPSSSTWREANIRQHKRVLSECSSSSNSEGEEWTPSAWGSASELSDSDSDGDFQKQPGKGGKTNKGSSGKYPSKETTGNGPDRSCQKSAPSTLGEDPVIRSAEHSAPPQEINSSAASDSDAPSISPPVCAVGIEINSTSNVQSSEVPVVQGGKEGETSGDGSVVGSGAACASDVVAVHSTPPVKNSETGTYVITVKSSAEAQSSKERDLPFQKNPEVGTCAAPNLGSSLNGSGAVQNVPIVVNTSDQTSHPNFRLNICRSSNTAGPAAILTTLPSAGLADPKNARPVLSNEAGSVGGGEVRITHAQEAAKMSAVKVFKLKDPSGEGVGAGGSRSSLAPAVGSTRTEKVAVPTAGVISNANEDRAAQIKITSLSMLNDYVHGTSASTGWNRSVCVTGNTGSHNSASKLLIPSTNSHDGPSVSSLIPGITMSAEHDRSKAISSVSSVGNQSVGTRFPGNSNVLLPVRTATVITIPRASSTNDGNETLFDPVFKKPNVMPAGTLKAFSPGELRIPVVQGTKKVVEPLNMVLKTIPNISSVAAGSSTTLAGRTANTNKPSRHLVKLMPRLEKGRSLDGDTFVPPRGKIQNVVTPEKDLAPTESSNIPPHRNNLVRFPGPPQNPGLNSGSFFAKRHSLIIPANHGEIMIATLKPTSSNPLTLQPAHGTNQLTLQPAHGPNPLTLQPAHGPNPLTLLPTHGPNQLTLLPAHGPNPLTLLPTHSPNQLTLLPTHSPNQLTLLPTHSPNQLTLLPAHSPNQLTLKNFVTGAPSALRWSLNNEKPSHPITHSVTLQSTQDKSHPGVGMKMVTQTASQPGSSTDYPQRSDLILNKSANSASKAGGSKVEGSQAQSTIVQSVSFGEPSLGRTKKSVSVKCLWCPAIFDDISLLTPHLSDEHQDKLTNLCRKSEEDGGGDEQDGFVPLASRSAAGGGESGEGASGGDPRVVECIELDDDEEEERERLRSPTGNFQCKYCPEFFTRRSHLKEHRKVFHSSRHHRRRKRHSDSVPTRDKPRQVQTVPPFYVSPRGVFMNSSGGPGQPRAEPKVIKDVEVAAAKGIVGESDKVVFGGASGKVSDDARTRGEEQVAKGNALQASAAAPEGALRTGVANGSGAEGGARGSVSQAKGVVSANVLGTLPDIARDKVVGKGVEGSVSEDGKGDPIDEIETQLEAMEKGIFKPPDQDSHASSVTSTPTSSKSTKSSGPQLENDSRNLSSTELGSKDPYKALDSNASSSTSSPASILPQRSVGSGPSGTALDSSPGTSAPESQSDHPAPIRCPRCPVSFTVMTKMWNHLIEHHMVSLSSIESDISRGACDANIQGGESEHNADKVAAQLVNCSMCNLKFNNKGECRDHYAKVHIPQLYERQRQKQIDKLYKGTGVSDEK